MKQHFKALSLYPEALKSPLIRKKFIFTILILALFRFIAHVPVPGVNITLLKSFFSQNQFLSLLDIFSGGTLANFSIAALIKTKRFNLFRLHPKLLLTTFFFGTF